MNSKSVALVIIFTIVALRMLSCVFGVYLAHGPASKISRSAHKPKALKVLDI